MPLKWGEVYFRKQEAFWVAVGDLNLSYYFGEAQLFTVYTHYGNLV